MRMSIVLATDSWATILPVVRRLEEQRSGTRSRSFSSCRPQRPKPSTSRTFGSSRKSAWSGSNRSFLWGLPARRA